MAKELTDKESGAKRESPRARVLRWLERAIASGEIARGAELPPEREIAKRLGVAPNTAAAAMDEAEVRGLAIRRRAGARKRYAGEVRKNGGNPLMSSTIFVLATLRQYTDIATAPGWSDEFLALDVVRRISLAGRSVSLLNSYSLPAGGLDAIFAARPGGMVVTNSVSGDPIAMKALAHCREAGIPAVAYGNAPELRAFDRTYSDHRAGSRDLTRWLIAHGCKRIVPFFPFAPTHFWAEERVAGYEEAMREAGLEPHPLAVFDSPAIDGQQKEEAFRIQTALAMATLLSLKQGDAFPDALLCINDDWAQPILEAINILHLDPRRDIIVAGYDNMVGRAGLWNPTKKKPAVTVDKHHERMAKELTDLLLARMDGTLPPEPQLRLHAHEVLEVKQ